MKYQWRPGTRAKLLPQLTGEELERIRLTNKGILTPTLVVESAAPPESPLHTGFEWDDTQAAQLHREQEARMLMNSLTVVLRDAPDQSPTRAFVSVQIGNTRSYTHIDVAIRSPDLRAQLLARAQKDFSSWERRYHELEELEGVFAAMNSVNVA